MNSTKHLCIVLIYLEAYELGDLLADISIITLTAAFELSFNLPSNLF